MRGEPKGIQVFSKACLSIPKNERTSQPEARVSLAPVIVFQIPSLPAAMKVSLRGFWDPETLSEFLLFSVLLSSSSTASALLACLPALIQLWNGPRLRLVAYAWAKSLRRSRYVSLGTD